MSKNGGRVSENTRRPARLRGKLLYRTPNVITAEIGVEINMMGVFNMEVYYAPVIAGGRPEIGGRTVDLGAGMVGARVILGYSAYYRKPHD